MESWPGTDLKSVIMLGQNIISNSSKTLTVLVPCECIPEFLPINVYIKSDRY